MQIHELIDKQREYFRSRKTLDVNFRVSQLEKLKFMILENEKKITKALEEDLGRCETESYICDILPTLREIDECIKHVKKWAKPERHYSGLLCFPSVTTLVNKMPYGVCLIISPFNFPVLLSLSVLAASISGGNCSVLKLSSKSKNTSEVLKKLIKNTFDEKYITALDGDHNIANKCLEQRFDKIFYTGSPNVAKHVMKEAGKNLTPVAFELGGETGNWCIIRKDADLKDAARKTAFAKILNSGQVCIDINQIAVAKEVADEFIELLKRELERQIGKNACDNPEYSKLITGKAFANCADTAKKYSDKIVFGGTGNEETQKYSPTVIYPVDINDDLVQSELFNPILPVVPFEDENELIKTIEQREHGLALYIFTKDVKRAKKMMSSMQFGGGCINDVIMHITAKNVPFNGTGHSGMGAYHGKWGFDEFTHPQTIQVGKNKFNLSLREHPYLGKANVRKLKILRFLRRF